MMKFYVRDCPQDKSIFNWIKESVDFEEAINDVSFSNSELIEIPHKINIDQLKQDTLDAIGKFAIKGWQTTRGESKAYGGLSMVYNPDLVEDVDINQHTLGTAKNRPDEFFYDKSSNFSSLRNTYFDSYAFRKISPAIASTGLSKFIDGFSLSLTRSRIAVLDADLYDKVGEDFLWHKDETVFENLRINIPIVTDEKFLFQIENKNPQHLEYGKLYTWDTHIPHRVYATEKYKTKRIHLVLGFSPWIDYIEEEDAFVVNSFFGTVHPFDILLKGLAHKDIGNG